MGLPCPDLPAKRAVSRPTRLAWCLACYCPPAP
nr:MAG TPA_asm: hypothetical protein [Caudoviricetes sp.]